MSNTRNELFDSPFVRAKGKVGTVMSDVVIALLPLLVFAYFARGEWALMVVAVAVLTALLTEFILSWFLLGKINSLKDFSGLVTGILLACTLSPFTPWYVVAFGAAMAVLFGKILWGGLGMNRFNPALVGREMMTVFFPAVMSSGLLWSSHAYVHTEEILFFGHFIQNEWGKYLDMLLFRTNGAIGEYSLIFIALGGLYLLLRKRISWHIVFGVFVSFFVFICLFDIAPSSYSLGGLLFGTIFMATDMPSSPSTPNGKLYYGIMIGVIAAFLVLQNVRFEYMSYSILIMNGFTQKINTLFKPLVWADKPQGKKKVEQVFLLTLAVAGVTLAVLQLHYLNAISYVVYAYIIYIILKFNLPNKISKEVQP